MSRIGKMPIAVPAGVKVNISGGDITVTGPKGELKRSFGPEISIALDGGSLKVSRSDDARESRARHGLTRSLLAHMVDGVTRGFTKELEIVGVGYKAEKAGDNLVLRVGYSHEVNIAPLPGIALAVEGANKIKVSGIDKETVGQMAAKIRAIKPPDSYKGKGIRYSGEKVRIKAGKTGKATGGGK